jgi:hypothetical protein
MKHFPHTYTRGIQHFHTTDSKNTPFFAREAKKQPHSFPFARTLIWLELQLSFLLFFYLRKNLSESQQLQGQ